MKVSRTLVLKILNKPLATIVRLAARADKHFRIKLSHRSSMAAAVVARLSFISGDTETALEMASDALVFEPANIQALSIIAEIFADNGEFEASHKAASQILYIDPQNIVAHEILQSLGRPADFSTAAADLHSKNPPVTPAGILASVRYLNHHSRFVRAAECAAEGLAMATCDRDKKRKIYQSLAIERALALERLGDVRGALDQLQSLSGDAPAAAAAIARCYTELGAFSKAAKVLGVDGQPVRPDYHIPEALAVLYGLGRIRDVHKRYHLRSTSQALSRLAGKKTIAGQGLPPKKENNLFLFAEAGPGDEIRCSTMYGQISELCRRVRITCDPRLYDLMTRSYPSIEFIPVARYRKELRRFANGRNEIQARPLRRFTTSKTLSIAQSSDRFGSVMDLLVSLRPSRESFASASFLVPDMDRVKRTSGVRLQGKTMIGISWRSLLMLPNREKHYFDVADLAPLSAIPNASFVVLQAGAQREEIDQLKAMLPSVLLWEDVDLVDDFDGQAAIISNLDAVVSPFTTMGELAGALGKPTLFLLSDSRGPAWRCGQGERDIWYPNALVIGSQSIGDRQETITIAAERIKAGLSL